MVRSGRMPFLGTRRRADAPRGHRPDPGGRRPTRRLVSRSRFVIVVIGTPVDEHLNPTFHKIRRFFTGFCPTWSTASAWCSGARSIPGTTEKIRELLAATGRDIRVAFCPERVAEGQAMEELASLPQIVSGCDERAVAMAAELFGQIARSIIRLDAARGRADQDLHQRLAVHPVRHRQPVLHDRDRLRPRLLPDLRGDDPRLSADGRAAPERVRRRALPVQGHDAAGRGRPTTTSPSATPRC